MSGGNKWYLLAPLCAVVAAYLNSFTGVFQLDDYNVIVFNPAVHSWPAFWQDCFHGIRPFLKLTYTLNWTSHAGIYGFHAFNLVVHIVSTMLVFFLTVRFFENSSGGPSKQVYPVAAITALLFGLHPIQTEAVTYISGRSASLMTMFYLGSLLAYVKGTREKRKAFLYLLSPFLLILGVATKEVAITLPLAFLLWETTAGCHEVSLRRILKDQAVHWALFVFLTLMLLAHPRYRLLVLYSFELRGFLENLLAQTGGVAYLLLNLFLPGRLNIDPDLPALTGLMPLRIFFIFVLAALAAAGVWKKKPWLSFGILWFFLHTMIVNVLVPRTDIINDRHFYQAGWGIFLIVSVVICSLSDRYLRNKSCLPVCIACISIILGGYTVARNHVYRSEVAMWEDTVKKSPGKARGYNNLGYAYYLDGRKDDARQAYLKALEIDPAFLLARNNLKLLEGP